MPLWQLLALAAALWGALLALVVAAGYRWQSVKPRAAHTPVRPAAPEEGIHV